MKKERRQLRILGMTCIHCQTTIERALRALDGITEVQVSYEKGTADFTIDEERQSLAQVYRAIEDAGYAVKEEAEDHTTEWIRRICFVLIILSLFVILQYTGVLNVLAPRTLADTRMGYGMLFVIGLVTSVHCIAMCGGIHLSQCIQTRYSANHASLLYNLGRVCSYTCIGIVFGTIGMLLGSQQSVGVSYVVQGLVKMAAGLFMVIMGINMLHLFPVLRKVRVLMPKKVTRIIERQKVKARGPFIVGLLNGFMPCGPLQSMWIVALSTGHPVAGGLSMLMFALGTVPLMLGLGTLISTLGKRFASQVMTVGAVLVIVLGMSMFSQGGTLAGWIPSLQTHSTGELQAVMKGNVQEITGTLQPGSYPDLRVRAGIPVRWVMHAEEGSINGCNYKIVIRDLGIEHVFEEGENVIEFTPTKPGTIAYSCWMGMIDGEIQVE